MQKFKLVSLVIALAALSFAACHHHDEDDTTDPVLTITSPTANASISGAVTIAGTLTDESLHELSIKITKDADNSELFSAAPSVHDETSYTIAETWTPTGITTETPVTLTVIAEDHSEHTVTKTVKFSVK